QADALIALPGAFELDQPEIEYFDEVPGRAEATDDHIRWLDVTVHEAVSMRVVERGADLLQEVDGALGRNRPETLDQGLEVHSVEELHDVVQRAIVGDAKIVELHGVRRLERGGRPRLALEAAQQHLRAAPGRRAEPLGSNELDGRR